MFTFLLTDLLAFIMVWNYRAGVTDKCNFGRPSIYPGRSRLNPIVYPLPLVSGMFGRGMVADSEQMIAWEDRAARNFSTLTLLRLRPLHRFAWHWCNQKE